MRIAMISRRQCIRVFKESFALTTFGHKVIGVSTNPTSYGSNLLDAQVMYRDDFTLQRTIKAIDSSVDLYHAHGDPMNLVRLIKEVSNKPVVWDDHDIESLRTGVIDQDEYDSYAMADAFVHVSEPCRAYAESIHKTGKPTLVLYSWINDKYVSKDVCMRPSWSSFVYEGGLSSEGFKKENDIIGTNMRWWYPVFKLLIDNKYNVTAFGAGDDYTDLKYQSLGVVLHANVPYTIMLNALQPHGFGLVGAFTTFPLMEAAMPNKLFEYISAGVVPVVLNAGEAAKFVVDNECGIVLNSSDNLEGQISPGPTLRKRVLEMRHSLVMEEQIPKLIQLYRSIL